MGESSELRVFISSTFRDLQEEREHLVNNIFPAFRKLCRDRGVTFTEVDLRWGLTEEDVVLGQVIGSCLEEVDKCRPYFIGITGNRYGYIPSYLDVQKDPSLLERYPWIEDAALGQMSITEMEANYAVLANTASDIDPEIARDRARFYFRQTSGNKAREEAEEEQRRLKQYQTRIRQSGVAVRDFEDAASVGKLIFQDLIEILDLDFADVRPPTALEDERARHGAFSLSRRHGYVANPEYLIALNKHAESDGAPFLVHGESGAGKSSLMAYWAQTYRTKHPDVHVVEHYLGIGATGSDRASIIRHVCMEIADRFGLSEEIPEDPEQLDEALLQWFGYADHKLSARGERMIVLLDALDQLCDDHSGLTWLPETVPAAIRLVLSSTSSTMLQEIERRGWSTIHMAPLTVEERETVIVRYLAEYRKALSTDQIRRIAKDPKSAHPLFLKTFLEELRLVGRHEDLEHRIDYNLASEGTDDLFQRMLERIELDHGESPVRALLSMLWCSRTGLDERELTDLTRLSRLKISAMTAGLDYHLVRKQGELTFFHDYLRRAVEKRYLSDIDERHRLHRAQAAYFAAHREANAWRRTDEPWHWKEAEEWERLGECVTDLDTFRTLTDGHHVYDLLAYWHSLEGHYDVVAGYVRRLRAREPDSEADPAELLCTLGDVYSLASWYWQAEWMYRTALLIRRHVLGPGHAQTLWTMHDLATLYYHESYYDERHGRSETILRRALSLARASDAIDPDLLVGLTMDLGAVLIAPDTLDEAEALFKYSLELLSQQGSATDQRVGEVKNNLGVICWKRERYEDALYYLNEALKLSRLRLGDVHPNVARMLSNIASITAKLGRFEEAEAVLRRGLDVISRTKGPDHPETLRYATNLVARMAEVGRYDEGIELITRVISARVQLHGESHALTLRSSRVLGRLLVRRGDVEEGFRLLRRVIEKQSTEFGPDHTDTLRSLEECRELLTETSYSDMTEWLDAF